MKPILFNTDMVRAILEGRKTATRRTCKIKINDHESVSHNRCVRAEYPSQNMNGVCVNFLDSNGFYVGAAKPPFHPGDILYVRETWAKSMAGTYIYKATDTPLILDQWRPSIHMPKEAARLFLRVTDVRAERLKKMTIDDFRKEGIKREEAHARGCRCQWATETCLEKPCSNRDAYEYLCWAPQFKKLWDSTINPLYLDLYAWKANPWVWVIGFERISKEEAERTGT